MSKVLNLEIDCCAECPYCQYNGDYGMSYDAGMDCTEGQSRTRIVNEGSYKDMRKSKMRKVIEAGVPDWCPLSDKGENDV